MFSGYNHEKKAPKRLHFDLRFMQKGNIMDYHQLYKEVMEKLHANLRPSIKLTPQDFQELGQGLQQLLLLASSSSFAEVQEDIKKILCLLNHTHNLSPAFDELFVKILQTRDATPEVLIFTLAAIQKHVIFLKHRNGEKAPFPVMQALRGPLSHSQAEVQEWTLRTIESLGGQGIVLKEDILKNKPGFFSFFNPHKKNAKKIIEGLEEKWRPPRKVSPK